MIAQWWNERILPVLTDRTLSPSWTGELRGRAFGQASGRVLEVGFGSGLNLEFYSAEVTEVLAVEPADLAWDRAQAAVGSFARPVSRIGLDGATLDLPDDSVDAVTSAFTMCTIPDLDSALAEIRRVLRPGGSFHFVEHSLHPNPRLAQWQRRVRPAWKKVAGGCHTDRDMPRLVEAAGFDLDSLDEFALPVARPMQVWGWITLGQASAR